MAWAAIVSLVGSISRHTNHSHSHSMFGWLILFHHMDMSVGLFHHSLATLFWRNQLMVAFSAYLAGRATMANVTHMMALSFMMMTGAGSCMLCGMWPVVEEIQTLSSTHPRLVSSQDCVRPSFASHSEISQLFTLTSLHQSCLIGLSLCLAKVCVVTPSFVLNQSFNLHGADSKASQVCITSPTQYITSTSRPAGVSI